MNRYYKHVQASANLVKRAVRHFMFLATSFLAQCHPVLIFYKHIYRRRILSTPAFRCDSEGDFEVHMVIPKQGVLDALWSLKTFYYFSGLRPVLVVHEDGSFDNNDVDLLKSHFTGARVVRRADADRAMQKFLSPYEHARAYRERGDFYCALKLFDVLHYSKKDKLLLLDADVLFFQKPVELLDCIRDAQACFNSDQQDAYVEGAFAYFDELYSQVNAGLLFINRRFYVERLPLIDEYFANAASVSEVADVNRHEQTLHAALLTKARAHRLSKQYQIADEPMTDSTVSHHFVANGGRDNLYRRGLDTLKQADFLKKVST